ncbi:hypothetical protein MMC16_005695 [Acarospora aff. strigata]|nr:hypothetical protein [Acarospora aff. strigata]
MGLPRLPPPLTPAQVAYIQTHLYEDQGPRVVATSITLMVLVVLAVVLRFIARNIRKLPWEIDDYFMLPALFFTVCLCVINLVCVHYGNGKHFPAVGLEKGVKVLQGIYFMSVTYGFTHFSIKMSLLLLYRRIFAKVNRAFVIGLYGTMIYTILWSGATVLVCIFQCTPISFFWEQILPVPPPDGHCIWIAATEVSLNILNTIGDIATLILPAIALWNLHMSRARKVAVGAIFLVGLFAVAAGIVRVFMVLKQGIDFTWDDADLVIWTAIEPAVGILCACFPVIAPAFSRTIIKTRFGSFGGGSAGSLLRRVWRSKGSRGSGGGGGGKSDDTVPLSFVSSSYSNNKTKAYVNTTEKKTHPFTQLSDVTDKDTRFVTPSNGSNGSSPTHPRKGSVPDYKIEGVLPTQTLRDKLDP